MNDLRTVAQQTLEAWDKDENGTLDHPLSGAMETLRAALEQPEQEPVAWLNMQPLYTHPPRREWRGLTEEEMKSTCADAWSYDPYVIARAVEAKLKERNV